jgi:hypothetical protein
MHHNYRNRHIFIKTGTNCGKNIALLMMISCIVFSGCWFIPYNAVITNVQTSDGTSSTAITITWNAVEGMDTYEYKIAASNTWVVESEMSNGDSGHKAFEAIFTDDGAWVEGEYTSTDPGSSAKGYKVKNLSSGDAVRIDWDELGFGTYALSATP